MKCSCRICSDEPDGAPAARRLLAEHLTPAQKKALHRAGAGLVIKGNKTGNLYLIHNDGNVCIADEKGECSGHGYCLDVGDIDYCRCDDGYNCQHNIPVADIVLAKKLLIEFDEATFLDEANRT